MQVFSSDVYFTVVTNALLASQKEYYSDLVAGDAANLLI